MADEFVKREDEGFEIPLSSESLNGIVKTEEKLQKEIESLTEEETKEFEELENKAESKFNGALESLREAGEILFKIKDKRYYTKRRINGSSEEPIFNQFKDYVRWRFNKSRTTGYNYIILFQIMSMLKSGGFDELEIGNLTNAIMLHEGARDLLKHESITEEDIDMWSSQAVRRFWQVVHDLSPVIAGRPVPTKELISSVIEVWEDAARTKTLEIDGEQVPIDLKGLLFEENVLDVVVEKVKMKKQILADEQEKAFERRLEEIPPRQLPPADVPNERKYFSLTCPVHGVTSPKTSVSAGFKTVCGCLALMTEISKENFEFLWSELSEEL